MHLLSMFDEAGQGFTYCHREWQTNSLRTDRRDRVFALHHLSM